MVTVAKLVAVENPVQVHGLGCCPEADVACLPDAA